MGMYIHVHTHCAPPPPTVDSFKLLKCKQNMKFPNSWTLGE